MSHWPSPYYLYMQLFPSMLIKVSWFPVFGQIHHIRKIKTVVHSCVQWGRKHYGLLFQIESKVLKPMLLAMENHYFDSS